MPKTKLDKIISHAKEYGFVFMGSDIYDGIQSIYDYGSNGVLLKNNIKDYWWKSMVQLNQNIVGLDTAILMHPNTWKASGHIDTFIDIFVDNKDSNKRYRIDTLLEAKIEKDKKELFKKLDKIPNPKTNDKIAIIPSYLSKIDAFDLESKWINYACSIIRDYITLKGIEKDITEEWMHTVCYKKHLHRKMIKLYRLEKDLAEALKKEDLELLHSMLDKHEIKCPLSGTKNWTKPKQLNLMLSTEIDSKRVYLRPETAQGIYINFLNVIKTTRQKVPFGIAQIGKAFRNEIIARQFIFRMREFEQMEMQFFIHPKEESKWYAYWCDKRLEWHKSLGLKHSNYTTYNHVKLSHYAKAALDIEFSFPFGVKELEGIHSRTDFDLKNHQLLSGKKLNYFDPIRNESYIPYIIETSLGLDRMFLAILCNSYVEDNDRIYLDIPPFLSPYQLAVFPLVKKDGLQEKANSIMREFMPNYNVYYEEKDSIGKRYARQDRIGTPYCLTVDYETLDNNTVTIRDRNTSQQERINIEQLDNFMKDKKSLL